MRGVRAQDSLSERSWTIALAFWHRLGPEPQGLVQFVPAFPSNIDRLSQVSAPNLLGVPTASDLQQTAATRLFWHGIRGHAFGVGWWIANRSRRLAPRSRSDGVLARGGLASDDGREVRRSAGRTRTQSPHRRRSHGRTGFRAYSCCITERRGFRAIRAAIHGIFSNSALQKRDARRSRRGALRGGPEAMNVEI